MSKTVTFSIAKSRLIEKRLKKAIQDIEFKIAQLGSSREIILTKNYIETSVKSMHETQVTVYNLVQDLININALRFYIRKEVAIANQNTGIDRKLEDAAFYQSLVSHYDKLFLNKYSGRFYGHKSTGFEKLSTEEIKFMLNEKATSLNENQDSSFTLHMFESKELIDEIRALSEKSQVKLTALQDEIAEMNASTKITLEFDQNQIDVMEKYSISI